MSQRIQLEKFLPGGKGNPAPAKIVKGIKTNTSSINTTLDLRKLNMILRRRHLGILDEQRVTQKTSKSRFFRGIDNYHIEEFVARSTPGFQCVARKSIDDFTAEFNPQTNSFKYKIILRHVPEFEIDNVVRAMNNIQTKGFINYYYGSEFMGPHVRKGLLPGLCLLQGHFAAAFELLCKAPRVLQQSITNKSPDNDNKAIELLKRTYSASQIEKQHALARELRRHRPIELTDALCKHTLEKVLGFDGCNHLVGEFAAIVWNETVSRRVRLLGARTICEGDFVAVVSKEEEEEEEKDLWNEKNTRTLEEDKMKATSTSLKEISRSDFEARELVRDINDTLLPTLGNLTYFSSNSEWKLLKTQSLIKLGVSAAIDEEELLLTSGGNNDDQVFDNGEQEEDEGGEVDQIDELIILMRSMQKSGEGIACSKLFPSLNFDQPPMWNFGGEYRRMIEYPQNLSWKLIPDIELTEQELGIRSTDRRRQNTTKSDQISSSSWEQEATNQKMIADAESQNKDDNNKNNNNLEIELQKNPIENKDQNHSRHHKTSALTAISPTNIFMDTLLNDKVKNNRPINGVVIPAKKAGTLHQLKLEFELPAFASPWMMLREMCKMERYVFDDGMKRSIENREEHVAHVDAEKAAIRRRIYNKIKRKYEWGQNGTGVVGPGSGSVHSSSMETARFVQSIFHSQGRRGSLMPNPRRPDDVHF